MTDVKILAIKHGAKLQTDPDVHEGFKDMIIFSNTAQLESLLAEHLALCSSEPVAYRWNQPTHWRYVDQTPPPPIDNAQSNEQK